MGLGINLLRPRDSFEAFYWRDRGLYSFRFESGNWTTVNISNPEKIFLIGSDSCLPFDFEDKYDCIYNNKLRNYSSDLTSNEYIYIRWRV